MTTFFSNKRKDQSHEFPFPFSCVSGLLVKRNNDEMIVYSFRQYHLPFEQQQGPEDQPYVYWHTLLQTFFTFPLNCIRQLLDSKHFLSMNFV